MLDKIKVLYGGRIVEEIFFNDITTGASDDMATDRISLNDIKDLTRTSPDQLGIGIWLQYRHRLSHRRHIVYACVSDTPGKN